MAPPCKNRGGAIYQLILSPVKLYTYDPWVRKYLFFAANLYPSLHGWCCVSYSGMNIKVSWATTVFNILMSGSFVVIAVYQYTGIREQCYRNDIKVPSLPPLFCSILRSDGFVSKVVENNATEMLSKHPLPPLFCSILSGFLRSNSFVAKVVENNATEINQSILRHHCGDCLEASWVQTRIKQNRCSIKDL